MVQPEFGEAPLAAHRGPAFQLPGDVIAMLLNRRALTWMTGRGRRRPRLSEDKVHVPLFLDAEGYADVHLGAHRALSHHFLGRALGGGHEGHGGRSA